MLIRVHVDVMFMTSRTMQLEQLRSGSKNVYGSDGISVSNAGKWDPYHSSVLKDLRLIRFSLEGKVPLGESCNANVHAMKIWRADMNRVWFSDEARCSSIM